MPRGMRRMLAPMFEKGGWGYPPQSDTGPVYRIGREKGGIPGYYAGMAEEERFSVLFFPEGEPRVSWYVLLPAKSPASIG